MFNARNALGLEISRDGIRYSVISRRKNVVTLGGYLLSPLPADTVKFSHREPNIIGRELFIEAVRSSYLRLLTQVTRVSVSLPDSVGRVMIVDLETRFKGRAEGADIIRWKLKKSGFQDIQEMHLDYRTLGERETGEVRALVSLISRDVVTQYEDALIDAGLEPNVIDFTSFNICRFFSDRLGSEGTFLFVSLYGSLLSVLLFSEGSLEFFRSKEISAGPGESVRLYQEITNSVLAAKEKSPGVTPDRVCFSASRHKAEELQEMLTESVSMQPIWLDCRMQVVPGDGVNLDQDTAFLLTGATGAALRNV